MTKVGEGNFSSRMDSETERCYQLQGREIDGATSQIRQCGWLDLPSLKRACVVNQPNALMITRLDVAANMEKYYVKSGDSKNSLIAISTEGWGKWFLKPKATNLPKGIKKIIDIIEENVNVKIEILSFGRDSNSICTL